MSLLSSRPALRWAVPAGVLAVALVAGGAGSVLSANAAPALPDRTAAQLLVDLQNAQVENFSGTVVEKADLGLPSIPTVGGHGSSNLSSLVSGTHTMRVWYGGPDKARFALLGTLGESDVIRNGNDVWLWSSSDKTATHYTLPTKSAADKDKATPPLVTPSPLPSSPKEAADLLLKAIDPTTKVSTDGTAKVAGRDAYELVVRAQGRGLQDRPDPAGRGLQGVRAAPGRRSSPRAAASRRSRSSSSRSASPSPDADQFKFTAPKGTKVTEGESSFLGEQGRQPGSRKGAPGKAPSRAGRGSRPTVVGKGWTSVLVLKGNSVPGTPAKSERRGRDGGAQLGSMLGSLPSVSGSWGSGRLLESKLFSALITDDGRVLIGAVSPDKLYAAASDPAAKATK